MKLYNICFRWKNEKGTNYGNINITTKKRLERRLRDIQLDDRIDYAIVRKEELVDGEYRVRDQNIVKNKIERKKENK